MPAQIESGVYNFERGVPWHTLGNSVVGDMTADEALRNGGLDWYVNKMPLYISVMNEWGTEDFIYQELPDNFAIVRDTDDSVLGVVGNRYTPVQNIEAFSFMDEIVGGGQAIYDSAWSLRGGKTVCLTAELTSKMKLPQDEDITTYVTVMNNHDGSGKFRIVVSPIRVVCMNTLNMAVRNARYTWEHKHTENWNSEDNMREARETLNLAHAYQEYITTTANELIGQAFMRSDFNKLAWTLLTNDVPFEDVTTQQKNRYEELYALYTNSPNLDNIRYTKWGAWNAVAEFVDYNGRYRGKDIADKRAESILMGRGVDEKTRAFQLLTA